MTINYKKIDEVKKVIKPWGYEKWIADGTPNFKYALKEIFFKKNYKTSIQFHEFKEETNYIQSGEGIFYYSADHIDVKKFQEGKYTKEEINEIITIYKK